MSLLDVLRSGVKIADRITKPLQPAVTYYRLLTPPKDNYGADNFASPVSLRAIIDWKSRQVRTSSGELTVTRAVVTLLDVDAVSAATGGAGIGDFDKFVLPDGTTGPILDLGGFIDAGTGHSLATEVMIG
jgi:hypothetical protein